MNRVDIHSDKHFLQLAFIADTHTPDSPEGYQDLKILISEVVKELPATLILRPFNFETLAVSTYIYAAEERMFQAASPAIAIVLIGLIPIIFLSKMIRKVHVIFDANHEIKLNFTQKRRTTKKIPK